ncbi:MAG: hypothetical protein JWO88_3620 [Frankiales bacterium]|nr:hypothetical protein [Frankiales bacterium]
MLPSKTVFIVGAGASQECGLPIGRGLKSTIATSLDLRFDYGARFVGSGDLRICDALRRAFPHDINVYLQACLSIRAGVGLSPSIDDFIDKHQHDKAIEVCGKLAIAHAILNAERGSTLHVDDSSTFNTIDFDAVADTWYTGFYELLSQGLPHSNLPDIFQNVAVVTFNYDRCIEHFLKYAIAANHRVSTDEARQRVDELILLRPYGSVGKMPFGSSNVPAVADVGKSLKTYTEKVEDAAGLAAIQNAVADAEVLVFLGNAFHENNLRLLGDVRDPDKVKRIYATRKGVSDTDLQLVKQRLSKLRGTATSKTSHDSHFYFADTCSELFDEYRMSLRT